VPDAAAAAAIADELARALAATGAERDRRGGHAKPERDLIRRSGLLRASIPTDLGGWGLGWPEVMAMVRRLAEADGSLAHLFGFHHLLLATVRLFGTPEQYRALAAASAAGDWFWGNALNPLDPRTVLTGGPDEFSMTGEKTFCSGALDSDMLIVSALRETDKKLIIAAIPTSREGVDVRDDWDNIGQRQTDSGSAGFRSVKIAADEILSSPGPLGSTFASIRSLIAQLVLCNVYLGLAAGGLAEARGYTLEQHRPRYAGAPNPVPPREDPYVLHDYGSMWVELEGARLLTERAGVTLGHVWARADDLTPAERGECSIAVAIAKAATTRVGLDLASRIFDVMSARATAHKLGFDRFWRNLRTHTLHDPVDHKLREIGDWVLNGAIPPPSFYS